MVKNNGWIKCSERLPSVGERVLVSHSMVTTIRYCESAKLCKGKECKYWELDTLEMDIGSNELLPFEAVSDLPRK
ncbi:DUF551 domain-containing protein [Aggregatibacter actinomycetemcomitans]|uniref:DUF551 domain-containing protein n=1 Tax=Aggregatibacter actinomycetemcomitans TaxID=714 RepID=A0A2G1DNI6_AGGAC|nr:hypothetical protein CQR80_08860 [Aggregatibacter actinomycetemcomitans]PHO22242.1 hypothetical protein CQR79_09105 [Aggregatibacter actinomycetemcomitans]BAS49105.1 hypothetical protein AANUM_1874 [Aggregatibacter actinomycetemcomitans NUM4039]